MTSRKRQPPRTRQERYKRKHQTLGLCLACPTIAVHNGMCPPCYAKHSITQRNLWRKKRGLSPDYTEPKLQERTTPMPLTAPAVRLLETMEHGSNELIHDTATDRFYVDLKVGPMWVRRTLVKQLVAHEKIVRTSDCTNQQVYYGVAKPEA